MHDGDAALVRRVLEGDALAYAGLVERHQGRLLRYATHLLGSRAEAEDAVQDALFRGYRFLDRCEAPDRVGAWLFSILVNRCRTVALRRRRSGEVLVGDPALLERPGPDPAGAHWPDDIARALQRLPADQREAFLLKHVEDLSYDEIARLTGAGVPALKMRVSRACSRLRELLGEPHA